MCYKLVQQVPGHFEALLNFGILEDVSTNLTTLRMTFVTANAEHVNVKKIASLFQIMFTALGGY